MTFLDDLAFAAEHATLCFGEHEIHSSTNHRMWLTCNGDQFGSTFVAEPDSLQSEARAWVTTTNLQHEVDASHAVALRLIKLVKTAGRLLVECDGKTLPCSVCEWRDEVDRLLS